MPSSFLQDAAAFAALIAGVGAIALWTNLLAGV